MRIRAGTPLMPQPLRVYRTHLGFYDAIVAAPSQKAALEAWGVRQNLFQKGMASVVGDDEIIRLARSKPGVVLRRMFGSKEKFAEKPRAPKAADIPKPEGRKRR
jgi:hypothetical protein